MPGTRKHQVIDGDAGGIDRGHLLMQLAAVATVDVGEDGDAMLFIGRGETDPPIVADLRQQLAAQAVLGRGGQVGTQLRVVHTPLQQMRAIGADVQHVAVHDHFEHVLHRGGPDRFDRRTGNELLHGRAHRRLVGLRGACREHRCHHHPLLHGPLHPSPADRGERATGDLAASSRSARVSRRQLLQQRAR